ncbi:MULTISPECIES: hypothetical protein [Thermus]|uniref:Uncharacterized protein n=1 Tax=Thermus scotoductus TaxID=37636 RepID=A0A430USW2_THESC|nr:MULTISPECIES: hypothetical protein [Thermus]RTI04104.1 hypothetical protein CSW30_13920 [Thermus scotoductus]RTI11630.1 hypothetical protein CSW27_11975 [Thermus scotoductus]UZX14651.1 hypothetical protein KQ693_08410 [Thermus sp. PS18]
MGEVLQKRFPDMVALFTGLGFLTVLAELVLTDHTEGIRILAPLAAGMGAGAILLGLGFPRGRVWATGLLLLVGGIGLLGLVEHMQEALEAFSPSVVRLVDKEGWEYPAYPGPLREGEKEGSPPPLAPLALSGLGLLGALALHARKP